MLLMTKIGQSRIWGGAAGRAPSPVTFDVPLYGKALRRATSRYRRVARHDARCALRSTAPGAFSRGVPMESQDLPCWRRDAPLSSPTLFAKAHKWGDFNARGGRPQNVGQTASP